MKIEDFIDNLENNNNYIYLIFGQILRIQY